MSPLIVGAKYGQSPIDLNKRVGIGGGQPATLIRAAEDLISPMAAHRSG